MFILLPQAINPNSEKILSVVRRGESISVGLSSNNRSATIVYRRSGTVVRQELGPPKGWFFLGRNDRSTPPWGRASAGVFRLTHKPVIWVLVQAEAPNNYESCGVMPLAWNGHKWQSQRIDRCPYFTDRGAFYVRASHLVVWDCNYDRGRMSPSRYWVEEYTLRGSRLVREWRRITKGRYNPGGGRFPPPDIVAKADDPLRELGLRWKWWAGR